jgi:hypothetical protein
MNLKVGLWLCIHGFYSLLIMKKNIALTGAVEDKNLIKKKEATK